MVKKNVLSVVAITASLLALVGTSQAFLMPVKNGQFDTAALGLGVEQYTPAFDLGGGWWTTNTSATRSCWYGIDAIDASRYPGGLGNGSGNKASMRFSRADANVNRQGYLRSPMLGDADATVELLIQANATYTLTVAVGNKTDDLFPGSNDNQRRNCIEFLAKDDPTDPDLLRLLAFKQVSDWPADGTWADYSLYFTTDANGVITATDGNLSQPSWNTVPGGGTIGRNVLDKALRIRLRGDTYTRPSAVYPQTVEWDNIRLDVQGVAPPTTGDLTIKKFFDCDQDGLKNYVDDKYLPNWEYHITGPNSYDQTLTTDALGEIKLTGLELGDYTITETVWKDHSITGSKSNPTIVTIAGGDDKTEMFGNVLNGDVNQDGVVDSVDFTILKANYGLSPMTWTQGNLNPLEDAAVDSIDFTILKAYFGQGVPPGPGAVPEPATLALLAIGALGLLARKRR